MGTPVSSINKTGRHDIAEILLKVALNTITLTLMRLELLFSGVILTFSWGYYLGNGTITPIVV